MGLQAEDVDMKVIINQLVFSGISVTATTIGKLRCSCPTWQSLAAGDSELWSALYITELEATRGPRPDADEQVFKQQYLRCIHVELSVSKSQGAAAPELELEEGPGTPRAKETSHDCRVPRRRVCTLTNRRAKAGSIPGARRLVCSEYSNGPSCR